MQRYTMSILISGRLKEGMEARHGVEYGAQRLRKMKSKEVKINI